MRGANGKVYQDPYTCAVAAQLAPQSVSDSPPNRGQVPSGSPTNKTPHGESGVEGGRGVKQVRLQ